MAAKLEQTAEPIRGPKRSISCNLSIYDSGSQVWPAPYSRDLTKEEAYIQKLDAHCLECRGAHLDDGAGTGASVVYSDAIAAHGFTHELANYGEYLSAPTEGKTYEYAKMISLKAMHLLGESLGVEIKVYGPDTHITTIVPLALDIEAKPENPALPVPPTPTISDSLNGHIVAALWHAGHVRRRLLLWPCDSFRCCNDGPIRRSPHPEVLLGTKETLLPACTSVEEAVKKHPDGDVIINFASSHSVYTSTLEILGKPGCFCIGNSGRFGHASPMTNSDLETANAKNAAMRKAKFIVPDTFEDLPQVLCEMYDRLVSIGFIVPKPRRKLAVFEDGFGLVQETIVIIAQ
ncbi:hypothetical protein BDY19DRAFT_1026417 [Irpex rosettiformis]|uniref:Uncharacterized protein n=1 Tax=Irpex rosettiformis TaxID=378272 RepID=A0ACB8TQ98_9APHY|nr:hypothetical protein BDY19DRAFT_1026417 [Irpex rosettiformis]